MTTRKFFIGTEGPFFYDDTVGAFRFETASGTITVDLISGQTPDAIDLSGGNIDGVTIGASTPDAITATTFACSAGTVVFSSITSSGLQLNGSSGNLIALNAGTDSATEDSWVKVDIGGGVGYIRVFATK